MSIPHCSACQVLFAALRLTQECWPEQTSRLWLAWPGHSVRLTGVWQVSPISPDNFVTGVRKCFQPQPTIWAFLNTPKSKSICYIHWFTTADSQYIVRARVGGCENRPIPPGRLQSNYENKHICREDSFQLNHCNRKVIKGRSGFLHSMWN